jgi:hypothetical protein
MDHGFGKPLTEETVDEGPYPGDERNEPEIFTHN